MKSVTQLDSLFRRIGLAKFRFALLGGAEPAELWLGPEEAEWLQVFIREMQAQGLLKEKDGHIRSPESSSLEGSTFMGLTVRLMCSPGIRVGATRPAEELTSERSRNGEDE